MKLGRVHAQSNQAGRIQGLPKEERPARLKLHQERFGNYVSEFCEFLLTTDILPGNDWLGNFYVRESEDWPTYLSESDLYRLSEIIRENREKR